MALGKSKYGEYGWVIEGFHGGVPTSGNFDGSTTPFTPFIDSTTTFFIDSTTTFTAGNDEPPIYEKVDVNKFDKELYEFVRDELFD